MRSSFEKTRFVKETECPYNIATVSFTAAAWKYESLFLPFLCPLPLADCVWTAHTTNPVPFILVNADPKYTLRENGCLADIVPTLIQLMGMEQPKEMTGESLLVEK